MSGPALSAIARILSAFYAQRYEKDPSFVLDSIFSHFSESDTEFDIEALHIWLDQQNASLSKLSIANQVRAYYAAAYETSEEQIEEQVALYFAQADTEFDCESFGVFFRQAVLGEPNAEGLREALKNLLPETDEEIAPVCPHLNIMQNTPRERRESDRVAAAFKEKVQTYRCPAYEGTTEHALRGVHPKSYGVLQAEFEVLAEDAPPTDSSIPILRNEHRVGIFAEPGKKLPCKMRFSGSGGMPFEVLDDTYSRQSHGLALKLLSAEGQTRHDFLLNNAPIFPSKEPSSALPQSESSLDQGTISLMDQVLATASDPGQPILMRQFSISAYAWGDTRAVKYAVFPSPNLGVSLEPSDLVTYNSILKERGTEFRSQALAFLAEKTQAPLELGFYVQFANSEHVASQGCPIDDETVEWLTPWHQVGKITVEAQTTGHATDGDLVFNPYHISGCEHLPLGRLNRARLWSYTTSEKTRHFENKVEHAPHPFHSPQSLRVAVVGAGASGLSAALALSEFGYKVSVFEKRESVGGHATSKNVLNGKHQRDPAFGAFRKRQWPNFWALLKTLNVEPISLGKCSDWFNSDFVGWYHQDGSPLKREPSVMEEGRVFAAALAKAVQDPEADGKTVGSLIRELGLSDEFITTWFLGGVILYFGGHPTAHYLDYPLRLIAWMWQNSIAEETTEPLELFRVKNESYMEAFTDLLESRGVNIICESQVAITKRSSESVTLDIDENGAGTRTETFGNVVLAIAPASARQILGVHARQEEIDALTEFTFTTDTVVVHQDTSVMPMDRTSWKLANIKLPNVEQAAPTTAETMPYTLCVPCNTDDSTPILATYDYAHAHEWPESADKFTFSHAVVNPKTQQLRRQVNAFQGVASVHYSGSWLRGLTLHEDAVVTGLESANRILGANGQYPLLLPPIALPKPFEELPANELRPPADFGGSISVVEAALKSMLHQVVGIEPRCLNDDTDVQALGMSSLHFAKLANKINASLPPTAESEIDITMLLQMDTLGEVTQYVFESIHGEQDLGDKADSVFATESPGVDSAQKSASREEKTGPSRRDFIESLEDYRDRETALSTALVMAVQGFSIICLFACVAICANLSFWVGTKICPNGGVLPWVMALPAAWSTYCVSYSAICIAVKWAVVGKLIPGRYRVYGSTHLRWWIANLFLNFGQQSIWLPFRDSHLGGWLLHLLGGNVHSGASFNIDGLSPALSLIDADLLTLGDRAYIRRGALLQCHAFLDQSFILAPITLEDRAVVWTRAVVEPGATIGQAGILEHHSVLTMGATLAAKTRGRGVPATALGMHNEVGVRAGSGVDKLVHTVMAFVVLPWLVAIGLGVAYGIMITLVDQPTLYSFDWRLWLCLWPVFIMTTLVLGALAVCAKWCVLGRVRAGQSENEKPARLAAVKFVTFLMMRMALFCPRDLRWLLVRSMGAKIAYGSVTDCPLVEVAYADLLTMEEGSFYSPAAYSDFATLRDGEVILEEVHLESTAYVGAYATLCAPTRLPPLSLLASTSALASDTEVESSQVWVGSPARKVPITLGDVTDDSHSLSGWPLFKNRLIDLSNHYFVVLLMSAVALIAYHLFANFIWPATEPVSIVVRTLASFGFILFSYAATTFGMLPLLRFDTELLRWLCVQDEEIRTKGFERSTWKFNVWHLLSNHLLPYGMLIDLYAGTPFQLWLARRLGAKIGKNVYLANGVGIREFTFTYIGNNVMLNRGSALIAHSELPNGRIIMKDIRLKEGSSMAFISYIVGGTDLPKGVLLGSLSRPFDSQELDAEREYNNTPCQRRD